MPYVHDFLPRRDVIVALVEAKWPRPDATARVKANVSAAARHFGVTPGALHDILTGRRQGHAETLRKIADGLGVPFSAIVDPVDRETAA